MARPPLTIGAILIWGVCGAAVATQRSPVDTGVITGTVVADSGAAVRLAQASLTGAEGSIKRMKETDDTGRFTFDGLPAGRYTIVVQKPGYLPAKFGQSRPGTATAGRLIDVARGQRVENLVIRMSQGGAIAGRITDDHGDPVFEATVVARRVGAPTAELNLGARTDERGQYRIGLVPPGEYSIYTTANTSSIPGSVLMQLAERQRALDVSTSAGAASTVSVQPGSAAFRNVLPVYYPGTVMPAEATSVRVEYAEQRGVDIVLQSVLSARVSGIVSMPDGRRVSRARVYFVEDGPSTPGLVEMTTRDGMFMAARLHPGRYSVYARAALDASDDRAGDGSIDGGMFANAASELYPGQTDVTVNVTDITDLAVSLQRGLKLTGTVSLEGEASSATRDLSGAFLGLTDVSVPVQDATMISPTPVAVDENGRFALPAVPPGRYRWRVFGDLAGLWPRSMMINGRDTLDVPLEVRSGQDITGAVLALRAQSSEIAGALLDTAGHPTSDYTVVLFPADPDLWVADARRIRAMPTGTDGRFSFSNLPGGSYRLAAVVDAEDGAWNTPTFLRTLLGSSTPVLLGEGEKKVKDLRIAR